MPRSLRSVLEQSMLFHDSMHPLWDVEPLSNQRSLAATGFCLIVRQHVTSQVLLAAHEIDVTAATLVRPTFEAYPGRCGAKLVRRMSGFRASCRPLRKH